MNLLTEIFGQGKDLTVIQMTCRGIVVLMISLVLIRISGRRSFSLHMPLDNIVTIMLGAILSRAVVGASDFLAVIVCSLAIVLMHRVLAWAIAHSKVFSKLVEGEKMLLFSAGKFSKVHMDRGLVCKEDVLQVVRKTALTEDLNKIETIYIERNGEISAIKK